MFVVLLSNLNQHTVELRNGKKHVNVNTFVESIDHVPSRQFIDHLRCTQLWQQFCEMWELCLDGLYMLQPMVEKHLFVEKRCPEDTKN